MVSNFNEDKRQRGMADFLNKGLFQSIRRCNAAILDLPGESPLKFPEQGTALFSFTVKVK